MLHCIVLVTYSHIPRVDLRHFEYAHLHGKGLEPKCNGLVILFELILGRSTAGDPGNGAKN